MDSGVGVPVEIGVGGVGLEGEVVVVVVVVVVGSEEKGTRMGQDERTGMAERTRVGGEWMLSS